MASVWVIEQGEYSDYRVVGVYSSRENTEAVAEKMNASSNTYDRGEVAEWPLDPGANEINQGMTQFLVWMLKDGEVERVEDRGLVSYDMQGSIRLFEREKIPHWAAQGKKTCLDATVWATDEKHAIKIVNEKRMQMLALDQWK